MKYLSLILNYLPGVLATVSTVETALSDQNGKTKKAVVLGAIQAGAQAAGQTIPESHVQVVSTLIDGVVTSLNTSGVFATKAK